MNSVEQQLLQNQSEMLGGIGRLEKGQEVANGRLGKLEDWKDTRPQNCPAVARRNRWPVILGSLGGLGGVAGAGTLVGRLAGWW